MTVVSMNYLLEAGVHFGHQKRRWNPKMKEYIFGSRDDIYIIDLQKTVKKLEEAYDALTKIIEDGGKVVFVGTKKQAQEASRECAERTGMYYVVERWLGGTLTNFKTIRSRVKRLEELEKMASDGTYELLPKKEVALLNKEYDKLNKYLCGIREMTELPKAIIIVDPNKEYNAIREARKLNIPVFGIVDTNCDPDMVDYIIPGNDDAVRSVKVVLNALTNAIAAVNGSEIIDVITDEEKKEPEIEEEIVEVKEEKEEEVVEKPAKPAKVKKTKMEETPKKDEEVNLTELTLVGLKELAKERGIKGYSKLKKEDLIKALK